MATTLRPDRGIPVEIGGVTFHLLYTFAVIDDMQSFYDAPMSEILDRLTADRTFYATAGHLIETLIRNDLYNNGFGEVQAPSYEQIMHTLTVRDTARIIKALFEGYAKDMPEKEEDEPDPEEEPDQINVARLLVIARTQMKMSEEEFWKTTPRKYFKLFEEYIALQGRKSGESSIDDLP